MSFHSYRKFTGIGVLFFLCGFFLPAFAQTQDTRPLEFGKPVERELKGEQIHSYLVELIGNDLLRVIVDQHDVDVVVTAYAPDGKKLKEVDSPNGTHGPESMRLIVDTAGSYRVEVRSLQKGDAGKYVVSLAEKRPATSEDREAEAKDVSVYQAREMTNQALEMTLQANALQSKGKYKDAEPLFQRALANYEKAVGPEHPWVATALNNLALLYQATGDYARAATLFLRALAIYEKTLGTEHRNVANALHNLASLYLTTGEYARALPLSLRSLSIWEKALGPEHLDVAKALTSLANLYRETGDYVRTLPLLQRSVAIREKAAGPEHPDVAIGLGNLALLYSETGDYARAAPLLQRALTIYEKALGPEHPFVATALASLALLYRNTGEYSRAAALFQRALVILEKVNGPEHPNVATTLGRLALLYHDLGYYARATPLFQRALAIYEKALGPEHPNVATALNNLALAYQYTGDATRAAPLYQRSLVIREKVHGSEHPVIAQSLNNLAGLYQDAGEYAQAASLYQRSLAIMEKAWGMEHPLVAQSLANLARVYSIIKDDTRAVSFYQRASEVRETNMVAYLNTGSQQQKQLYLNTLGGETHRIVSLHAQDTPQNPNSARLAVTIILRRKGRALDAFAGQLETLRRRATPEDKKLLDDLAAIQSQLASLQLGDSKLTPEAKRAEYSRLTAEHERLEDAISRSSAEFRAVHQPVTLEGVQAVVPTNAALVELFIYRPFNAKAKAGEKQYGEAHYVAYVVRAKDSAIQFVDLGEAASINAEAAKFRAALQSATTPAAQVKKLARSLDERVMRPIRKLLGNTRRVFLAPDGALNLIPYSALVDENGKYLVEDYEINYLTSGRDLLRLQVARVSNEAPAILANPIFDMTGSPSTNAAERRAIGMLGSDDKENTETRATDFTTLYYPPLNGTAGEASSLGALFPNARVWTQTDATEAALKSINQPSILHIATHGFFLPDQLQMAPGVTATSQQSTATGPPQGNPMLRSGLILAGVKQKESGTGEDGVLTAQEAAGLNLFGTKLVVLSACETGLGAVQNGAGVYGLRRAFVLAGTETQVMSLWRVSDMATRDLMIGYYTRLQSGEGRIAAMRQVQLAMLRGTVLVKMGRQRGKGAADIKSKAEWQHPYYWAAFIPSGAWTTLDGKEPK